MNNFFLSRYKLKIISLAYINNYVENLSIMINEQYSNKF